MKKSQPVPAPVVRDHNEESGVRRAMNEVEQGLRDAVMDVKEGVGRVTNNPRYGAHGTEPGKPSACVSRSVDDRAFDDVRRRRQASGVSARRALGGRDVRARHPLGEGRRDRLQDVWPDLARATIGG